MDCYGVSGSIAAIPPIALSRRTNPPFNPPTYLLGREAVAVVLAGLAQHAVLLVQEEAPILLHEVVLAHAGALPGLGLRRGAEQNGKGGGIMG